MDHTAHSAAFRRFVGGAFGVLVALLPLQLSYAQPDDAPATDPNLAHPTQLVTVAIQNYTISGLVTHLKDAKNLKYGVALFPGHPGILRLREENGQFRFDLRGNFLSRSRRHWLDDETLVVLVDAPSDQWTTFYQQWRETPRYGTDVAALLKEIGRRFKLEDWTLVGTSEGSISAFHAGRMNQDLARRIILTSSVFQEGKNGPGLLHVRFDGVKAPILWVHHQDDPCPFTAYFEAKRFAEKSKSPLVTVRGGGPARGRPCDAFTQHGFVGIEVPTVKAMHSWIKTGAVPNDVGK
ncbi:MAG: alpha/beta fold hydrolase [Gammaproteobacteria bacterium]